MKDNIVLYDGDCQLCQRTVLFLKNIDRHQRLHTLPFHSEDAQQLLEQYSLSKSNFDSVIFIQNQRVYQKSTATLKICSTIGGIWRLLSIFILISRPLRDFFYDIVAKNRKRILCSKSDDSQQD